VTKPTEYKYDVAFSFLGADEPEARKTDDALEALTLKRFLYSDRQKEIAAKDGVDVFSTTFRRESRVVVVFHRKGWGATNWTYIEANAIKSRALEDRDLDSILFVPLDDSPLPDWVPSQRIYFDLRVFGHAALAATIAQKAKEAGSEVRKIGIAERGALAARRMTYENDRARFVGPDGPGIGLAHAAAADLQKEFERLAAEASVPPLTLKYEQTKLARGGQGEGAVTGPGHSASFFFRPYASNSLNGAELTVEVWTGPSPLLGRHFVSEAPKCLNSSTYEFDLAPDGSTGWRKSKQSDGPIVSSAQLAEETLNRLLDAIGKAATRRGL
jgi:hypothetical protein